MDNVRREGAKSAGFPRVLLETDTKTPRSREDESERYILCVFCRHLTLGIQKGSVICMPAPNVKS